MISNRIFMLAVAGALACAPVAWASEKGDGPSDDVLSLYQEKVRANATGVYELEGWVFFHDRAKVSGNAMFAEMTALRKALPRVNKALLDKIDEMTAARPPIVPSAMHADIRARATRNGSPSTVVQRSVQGLPTSVVYQGMDDGEYVYDMAIRKSDLEAEAAKGRFEDRPGTIEQHWKLVVRERLFGKDRMSFIRDCGAIDLWTLESAKTCGVRELLATNGTEAACCRRCLADLGTSAARAKVPAAVEYGSLVARLEDELARELALVPELETNKVVKMMVMSFGCCVPVEKREIAADLDAAAEYAGQDKDAKATLIAVSSLLTHTPCSRFYWNVFGGACLRNDMLHMALASFRNVLRRHPDDAAALTGVACAYERLGLRELARGAALVALAARTDAAQEADVRRILEEKR